MSPTAAARPMAATLLLLATLLGTAGCSQGLFQQDLVKPDGPEGKVCLERCELSRSQCQTRQKVRETQCQERFAAAQADYQDCIKSGSGNCRAPFACLGADMSICDQQYDDCFTACGGRVERRMRSIGASPTAAGSDTPSASASAPGESPAPKGQKDFGAAP